MPPSHISPAATIPPAIDRELDPIRSEAGSRWSPRAVTRLAGLDIAVGRDDGSEHTAPDCVIYLWHTDARERDTTILAELSRALLLRHGLPAGDREALALALSLTGDVASLSLRPGVEARLSALAA